jgi:hypothetical protein
MKRLVVALLLAVLAVPAFAASSEEEGMKSAWATDHNFIAPAP